MFYDEFERIFRQMFQNNYNVIVYVYFLLKKLIIEQKLKYVMFPRLFFEISNI